MKALHLPPREAIMISAAYVLEEAKANIEFIKQNRANVDQAHEINTALANIVAMERNVVMDRAIERGLRREQDIAMQDLPEPGPSEVGGEASEPVSPVLGESSARVLEQDPFSEDYGKPV